MSSSEDGQQKPSIHRGVILTLPWPPSLTMTPFPKEVIKCQPPNIAMFGIKLTVLMSTLTIGVLYDLHLNVKLGQKSSRYLECNKSYDGLHPETAAQNSSQIPVGAQGFVGSSPHPGCMMVSSNHQMCPALNSKPYSSNKQVVPLLGCSVLMPRAPQETI